VLTNFDGIETEIFVALGILTEDGRDGPNQLDPIRSPLVGESKGGGDRITSAAGIPPTPNPSPQGGGGLTARVRRALGGRHV
jgi:hypothetical protein